MTGIRAAPSSRGVSLLYARGGVNNLVQRGLAVETGGAGLVGGSTVNGQAPKGKEE